jgi:hypothetical protein
MKLLDPGMLFLSLFSAGNPYSLHRHPIAAIGAGAGAAGEPDARRPPGTAILESSCASRRK